MTVRKKSKKENRNFCERNVGSQNSMRRSAAPSQAKRVRTTTVAKKKATIKRPVFVKQDIGQGFPLQLTSTLKYCETIQLTSTSGVINAQRFTCNGLFDPNITGTGHQPYYFDQLMAIYNHYTVLKSTIKVNIVPANTSTVPFSIVLWINDDTAAASLSTIDLANEYLKGQRRDFPQGAGGPQVIYASWDAKKTFGGNILDNDDLQGTAAANPTEICVYNINMQSMDISTTTTCYLAVEIQYTAVFEELKDLSSS